MTGDPVYDTKSSYSFRGSPLRQLCLRNNSPPKPSALTVLEDEDGDGIHDQTDTCLIDGCTVQQLTDAYALLTSANACSGSRRTHAHRHIWCVCDGTVHYTSTDSGNQGCFRGETHSVLHINYVVA